MTRTNIRWLPAAFRETALGDHRDTEEIEDSGRSWEPQHLETLDVSHNEGITELPSEIGNLHQLEALYLRATGDTRETAVF